MTIYCYTLISLRKLIELFYDIYRPRLSVLSVDFDESRKDMVETYIFLSMYESDFSDNLGET